MHPPDRRWVPLPDDVLRTNGPEPGRRHGVAEDLPAATELDEDSDPLRLLRASVQRREHPESVL